jgi:transcriptional regulator with XRE-family HTH domain
MTLGELLREKRQARKIGLREMARRIGKSPTYLSKIEKGECEPGVPVLLGYAHQLHESSDRLLLSAGRVPPDVLPILQSHPELLQLIRSQAPDKVL